MIFWGFMHEQPVGLRSASQIMTDLVLLPKSAQDTIGRGNIGRKQVRNLKYSAKFITGCFNL